jgi:uncharacterized protein YkwD
MKRIVQELLIVASLVLSATIVPPHAVHADGPTPSPALPPSLLPYLPPSLLPSLLPYVQGQRATVVFPTTTQPASGVSTPSGISTPVQQVAPVPNTPSSSCTVAAAEAALDSEENNLLSLLNTYRAQHNLPALKPSDTLNQAAAWLSVDSAQRGVSSHIDSRGRDTGQRLRECGFAWTAYRENIYYAYPPGSSGASAQGAFTWWQNSPSHNANMLASDVTLVGVARACNSSTCYWTLDLGNQ